MAKKLIRKDGEEVVVDRAIKDGNGNVITSTYVGKVGDQDIAGSLSVDDSLSVIGDSASVLVGQAPTSGLLVQTTPGNYPQLVFNKGSGEGGGTLAGKTTLTQNSNVGTSVSLMLPASSGTLALTTDIPEGVDAYTKTESDARYVQLNPADQEYQTIAGGVNFETSDGENVAIGDGHISYKNSSSALFSTTLQFASPSAPGLITIPGNKTGVMALTSDIPDVSGLATKAEVDAKQDELTATQMNAVNSGITSAKVSTYDGYATQISGKQSDLGLTWEDYA